MFFNERYPHSIFADGGTFVPTQEKKIIYIYIFKHAPDPRLAAKYARTPLEAFFLFINHEMLNTIAEDTNTVIETFLAGKQDMINDSDKYLLYKKVDLIDIKAFLMLLHLHIRLKLNMFDRETIWHHEMAKDFFEVMMSLFISRFMTFDEKSTQAERYRYDKFACMQSFFESFNKNISKFCYPSSYLAVDETLYPYHGRIGFKWYNPSKPVKYGLLHHSFCDATAPYLYFSLLYAGKLKVLNKENPATSYYVTGTDEYTKILSMASPPLPICLVADLYG